MPHFECEKLYGAWLADFIRASGHACRIQRPDTRLHPDQCQNVPKVLAMRAPFSNRVPSVKAAVYLATRVTVLFAVSPSCRNIWSGLEDRHCKVHNELTLITCSPARRAIARAFALGRCLSAYLMPLDELRCFGWRCPAEWLARSPDTVQDYGQLAGQGYPCLPWARASLDCLGPVL